MTALAACAAAAWLAVCPSVPTASAACSDYANAMHWIFGSSSWHYTPGGYDHGTIDLVRSGDKVVASDDQAGLSVWEEVAPGQIAWRGGLSVEPGGLAADTDRAYVATVDGFRIVDISDPTHLRLIASLDIPGANHVAVSRSWAFVGTSSELTTVQLSGIPMVVGHLPGAVGDLVVRGNRAYVITPSGLRVVNISVPASPSYMGTVWASNSLTDLALAGSTLYVTQPSGLRIFTLADPDFPALLGSIGLTNAETVVADGEEALIGSNSGIIFVDVRDPVAPQLRGTYPGISIWGGALRPGFLYYAAGYYGIQTLALGTGTMPAVIAALPQSAGGVDLHAEGGILTLLKPSVLQTIDVSSPEAPVPIGSLAVSGAMGMAVQGGHAYVTAHDSLKVIDVSDPSAPIVVGVLPGVPSTDVHVSGDRVYLTQFWGPDLWIVDVSEPSAPILLGHALLSVFSSQQAATVIGSRFFTGGNFEATGYLDEWDVSDPNNVQHVDQTFFYSEDIIDLAPVSDRLIVTTSKGVYAADPNNLWQHEHLGDHPFGGAIGVGSGGRFCTGTTDGAYAVFSYDGALHYHGSGATAGGFSSQAGIADIEGYVYVTDASGLRVFGPECTTSEVPAPSPALHAETGGLRFSPNPAVRAAVLELSLPPSCSGEIGIFDPSGRLVRTIRSARAALGFPRIAWDRCDDAGREVPPGMYLARVRTPAGMAIGKVILLP